MAKAATPDPHMSCIQPEQPGSSPDGPSFQRWIDHQVCVKHAGVARPERFELPTTWFEVRSLVVNLLYLKKCREDARCFRCTTVRNHAQLNHAKFPQ